MFSWFKRKAKKEKLKVLYQNDLAIMGFIGHVVGSVNHMDFDLVGEVQGMIITGNIDSELLSQSLGGKAAEIVESMAVTHKKNGEIGERLMEDGGISHEEFEFLFAVNKDMRQLYQSMPLSRIKSFDENHAPPGGWEMYYSGRV